MKKTTVTVLSISNYGSSGSMIKIKIDDTEYSYTTTNLELAEWARYEKSMLHKEALNYLVAKCLLHNEISYDELVIIK